MRILRIIFNFLVLVLISLIMVWVILPRGYFLLKFLEKNGLLVYPEAIKEDLFSTRFYRIYFALKGFRVTIPEARLDWRGLEIPCAPNGYLRISYLPPQNLRLVFKDFRAHCTGRDDFEKVSGTLTYRHPQGLFGKLRVSGFRSPTGPTTVLLKFSGRELYLRFSRFSRRIPLFSPAR
ncbi:MAG TPA: hypothetical protein ENJ40_09275 [Thermosulfurimonas dismutans]|uniref:Uncharacterized protein n=1 Tax=Thermosulfurimonas dismutans TaxID=999894 RepID=A0A7C3H5U0_9BACT|nr:hypothetical protein [Thermosulfurimonas dismutans]